MKKAITAGLAGLILIASQAAATTNGSVLSAGSRVGSANSDAEQLEGGPPLLLLVAAAAVVTIFVVAVTQDDNPSSP